MAGSAGGDQRVTRLAVIEMCEHICGARALCPCKAVGILIGMEGAGRGGTHSIAVPAKIPSLFLALYFGPAGKL